MQSHLNLSNERNESSNLRNFSNKFHNKTRKLKRILKYTQNTRHYIIYVEATKISEWSFVLIKFLFYKFHK